MTMRPTEELETYRDLLGYLGTLTDAELDQPIQAIVSDPIQGDTLPLSFVHAIGTVGDLSRCGEGDYQPTRSTFDNDHHPKSLVLLVDGNPFDEDGSIAMDLLSGERIFANPKAKDWTS